MPGKQAVPLWLTILVGIVAAIIGNYVATLLGVGDTFGFDWIRHGLQLLFAVIGIGALAGMYAKEGLIDRCGVSQRLVTPAATVAGSAARLENPPGPQMDSQRTVSVPSSRTKRESREVTGV